MDKIISAFKEFNDYNILVIGDVMIDAYMWGNVDRISPEAPVPIISVSKRENRMGGAANVGLNIRALGANAVMCAVIGDDENGNVFKGLLKKRNMTDEGILVSENRQTTIKTRVISDNQHLLRVDEESTDSIDVDLEDKFITHIAKLFEKRTFDAVIFEDYDKGNITPRIIDFVVAKANGKQIPTLVDPKKANFLNYKGVTLFKPNFKEICEGLNISISKNDFEELHQSAKELKTILNAKYIMITLSELGVFITNGDCFYKMPAQIRDIADVSGAGDTVISVAACCLAANLDINLVAGISNLAGGLVCEKIGVVPVDKQLLLDESVKYFA